jgi:hypothetical protein
LADNVDDTWTSERDKNLYHAMTKGSRLSRGEYLWFMNSGDVFGDPEVLARVAAAIEHEGSPDWLYGVARHVAPDKSLCGVIAVVPFSMFNVAVLQRPLPHQAATFKRDFFWRLGGYDEEFGIAADQKFMVSAAISSPPLVLADFLCDFDSTGRSAHQSWWVIRWDGYKLRRQTGVKVTGSRLLDNLFAFGYALLRFLGLSFGTKLRRLNATSNLSLDIGR